MAAVLRRRRYVHGIPVHELTGDTNRYAPTTETTLSIIFRNIQELRKKQTLITQIKQSIRAKEIRCLDKQQRMILSSNDRVIRQLGVLDELFQEFSNAASGIGDCPPDVIARRLHDLHKADDLTSRVEDRLRQNLPVEGEELNCLTSKPGVVHQIDVLEKIYREISFGQLRPWSGTKPGRGVDETFHLNPMVSKSRGLAEVSAFQSRDEVFRLRMNGNKKSEVISRVESETVDLDKERYLCIANGFEIFCLDLKLSNDQTFNKAADVPYMPRIATLDLCEENLPTPAGLFKWRSNAYMIGGRKPSRSLHANSMGRRGFYYSVQSVRPRNDLEMHAPKDTSRLAHALSLTENNATLSHSEAENVLKLKKPKTWPIVEEINGQIHVMGLTPAKGRYRKNRDSLFSHEVFDPDTGIWVEVITPNVSSNWHSDESESEDMYPEEPDLDDMLYINCYVAIGDRIYADATCDGYNRVFLVFDSNEKKWETHKSQSKCDPIKDPPHFLKEVREILGRGPTRCAGKFPYERQPGDPQLYVILVLEDQERYQRRYEDQRNYYNAMQAVAYLVTSTGQIICDQALPRFFKGPVWPFVTLHGTIIQVDNDKAEEKKTMCSIVMAGGSDLDDYSYVFINTFTVEMLSDAAAMIRERVEKGSEASRPRRFERDFVRVDTKGSYIYKRDSELGLGLDWEQRWAGIQACFL